MTAVNTSSHDITNSLSHTPENIVSRADAPSPGMLAQSDNHSRNERLFIGPMPTKVVIPATERAVASGRLSGSPKKPWWLTLRDRVRMNEDNDNDFEDDVPEGHAFRYFLLRGGNEEEWGTQENLRKRIKRDMLRQLKQSGWVSLLHHGNKGGQQSKKWIGRTFQIGNDFWGVPLQTEAEASSVKSTTSTTQSEMPVPISSLNVPATTSRGLSAESYHAALEGQSGPPVLQISARSSLSDPNNHDATSNGSGVALLPSGANEGLAPRRVVSLPRLLSTPSSPGKSVTDDHSVGPKSLLVKSDTSRIVTGDIESSDNKPVPRSAIRHLQESPRGKRVKFSPMPEEQPASPTEVLARRSSHDPETSAGAAAAQEQVKDLQGHDINYGDVVLRDRMLVRRSYAKSEKLGTYFDAEQAMKLRDLHSHEWKEFLVVWRKKQLELYEDYSIPGKEMMLGHKHLACVIPLEKPDTQLSLYSFVDLTFCLTCTMLHVPKDRTRTATSLTSRIHFHRSVGTDIFVFKTKARSRGVDWMWGLWRELGNEIPPTFEVHCPAVDTRVRLHVPEFDATGGEGYKVFTHDHVVGLCRKALKEMPAWDYLVERPINSGARLELCWRREAMLDWVCWETDMDGKQRDWAVLYGMCLRKPCEITHLEARIAEHRPTTVALNDGTHFQEPPSIEGYLWRIKPTTQTRAEVYLSTHKGCLFSIHPSRARPPRPPIPATDDSQTAEEEEDTSASFHDQELRRGGQQVLQADVFMDLRSIAAVRRAFQISAPTQHLENPQNGLNSSSGAADMAQTNEEDEEDTGGDEVLAQHPNKPALKVRRSFELLMRNGHVVRFEAYSCKTALEWIHHLSRLIEYWRHRHRIDAREEMDLIHAITGNPQDALMKPSAETVPERPPDYDSSSEYLPSFWNWCILEGCLSVVRNGRLFLRRGLRGQYKLMQLVLASGHLIQFHITHGTSHHSRSKTISLLDAYVCSGHFAIQSLPVDEFLSNREPLPRRFQDGLESEDLESDTVFVIWYRPHAIGKINDSLGTEKRPSEPPIPSLNAKHKVLVLKARSKLERDAWCWALNAEIERISRKLGDREAKARDGGLAKA